VARQRLDRNCLAGIRRLNGETDVRHARRALTTEEFRLLLQSARESGKSIQRYDGETRARIYTLSYMTGLRKGEIASLTAASFHLDENPPVLIVEASASKHRRKDTLPLHPDLVGMIREWISDVDPDEPLFPKLASRKTWQMVKKDLERAGIEYKTKDGIADFHAAGRHTYITELLRNGATLPEAKELARHSDVRMTMGYTHIGIEDQARALSKLPSPCQEIVRKSAVIGRPDVSAGGGERQREDAGSDEASRVKERRYDTKRQKKTPPDTDGAQWRRPQGLATGLGFLPVSPPLLSRT
jgi:integrase